MNQPPTTLLLARHGQSEWNEIGRWQGRAESALSEHGRKQALLAAGAVGDVDLIAASPQLRAIETATIIGEHLGVGPIVVVDGIQERDIASWSGLTTAQIEQQWPGWLEAGKRPDGWETDRNLVDRIDPALRGLVAEYPGGTILVICHGGVIRAVEQHLGIDVGRVPNLAGRVISMQTNSQEWLAGELIQLLPEDVGTGGDPFRA